MASAAGALTNTVFGVVKASIVLAAIAAAGGTVAGYDAQQGATYSWLCQALVATVGMFGWRELADRIRRCGLVDDSTLLEILSCSAQGVW